jgi:hypothetical protein
MTKYWGISIGYKGKRYIYGNGTNGFDVYSVGYAKRFASFVNQGIKLGYSKFKKASNAKVTELHKGRTYNVIEWKSTCIVIKRRVFTPHAGRAK